MTISLKFLFNSVIITDNLAPVAILSIEYDKQKNMFVNFCDSIDCYFIFLFAIGCRLSGYL